MKRFLWRTLLCLCLCALVYAGTLCVREQNREAEGWSGFELIVEGKNLSREYPVLLFAQGAASNADVMLPFLPIASALGCTITAQENGCFLIEYEGQDYLLDTGAGTLVLSGNSAAPGVDLFMLTLGEHPPKSTFFAGDVFYVDVDSTKGFIVAKMGCRMEIDPEKRTIIISRRNEKGAED